MGLKAIAFSAAFAAIAASRADRWLRPLARGEGVILMFHQVRPWHERPFAPNRLLEITPEFLDRTLGMLRAMDFDIVPLDDLPGRLAEPRGRPFAVLTFDDGYRDNRDYAAPVLRRHEAPWTLYVATDYADGTGQLWWIELEEAIARSDSLVMRQADGSELRLPAETPAQKAAAFERIYWDLRGGPEPAMRDEIARLAAEAGIDRAALVRENCLSFDELRALRDEPGLTIAAHTLSHPMLAKHDEPTARREIAESGRRIAAELDCDIRHFAYPVGDPGSAGPREFALAREAGYATAVTTRRGHVFREHAKHLTALPRVSINGSYQSESALRGLLSGVAYLAFNPLRRADLS